MFSRLCERLTLSIGSDTGRVSYLGFAGLELSGSVVHPTAEHGVLGAILRRRAGPTELPGYEVLGSLR